MRVEFCEAGVAGGVYEILGVEEEVIDLFEAEVVAEVGPDGGVGTVEGVEEEGGVDFCVVLHYLWEGEFGVGRGGGVAEGGCLCC